MRILMVEDEKPMAEAVEQILKKKHYTVDLAFDGEYGLACAQSGIYDVIILDIMLPKRDGISILTALRREKIATPVILLTAKSETGDKVAGLDSGADDYLAKPFQTEELLARIRALSRRPGGMISDHILPFGDTELNLRTLSLRCNGTAFNLTLKECQLLELLIKNSGMIVSKDTIIEKLWGYDSDAEDNHVEVYISFLRKKLNHAGSLVSIRTVRGAGYMFEK